MNADYIALGDRLAHSGKYTAAAADCDEIPPPDEPDDDGAVRVDEHQDEPTTWEPIDLAAWLSQQHQRPEPTLGLVRTDGVRLIYPGREHAVLGETESGKSWLALGCVAAELAAGRPVVYLHFEEPDPGSTLERLQLLGVSADMLRWLRFAAPARPVRQEWLDALLEPPPTLVVLDGINEAMSLHGNDIMAAEGASSFRRRVIMPFLRVGAATLACDHVPKNTDGRGRDAYGSVHKGNAIDGARIVLENVEPFGRGMRGASSVFITKDRPGQLRVHGKPDTKMAGKTFFGMLVVDDSSTAGADFLSFYAPKSGDDNEAKRDHAAELADVLFEIVAAQPEQTVTSSRTLYALLRLSGHQVRDATARNAVDDLLVAGRLEEVRGRNNAKGYRAVSSASHLPTDTDG